MALPLATSTYTVLRCDTANDDSGDPMVYVPVVTGVPGVSMFHSGSESVAHGHRERVDVRIAMESPVEIRYFDKVTDEITGDEWDVAWVRKRVGLGMDHWLVGCVEITGAARGTKDL